ncbi:MAG: aminomethyl-transferring glycine dehydrogenase subunit GcvPA [Nitrospinae bacterium]|nr:aminomethyl-transferring glycine dehydrogenase subunit GcvPA [Nitrospinota bacterium]
MRYIPHTPTDIRDMLSAIGIEKLEELFHSIPDALRLEAPLNLPAALPEADLVQALNRLGQRNLNPEECAVFLGAGAYRHFTPALVNHLLLRGEFLTSYTPYQPEVSQGTLQAIFEFQSFVCMLTGMEIANASIYDGASSLAEAVLMAHRVNHRNEVLMARTVHPEYRQVVETYTRGIDFKITEVPYQENGQTDLDFIRQHVTDDISSVVIQSPNFFGIVEQYAELGEFLKGKQTLLIVVVAEATSLGILKPPGQRGADIVAGEGQGWGLPVAFGGPYVGFFATREPFFRQVPGRIVGETVDRTGQRLSQKWFLHRPAGLGPRQQDRGRLPRSGRVHLTDKRGHLHRHGRVGFGGFGGDLLPRQIAAGAEILLRGRRREGVTLQVEAQQRDAFCSPHCHG